MKKISLLLFLFLLFTQMHSAKVQPERKDLSAKTTFVSINPNITFQTIEGWGGSLCWWANIAGNYSNDSIKQICDYITDPINGLNMNLFRFNIGGGDHPEHDHMRKDGGAMPGYKAAADKPYDWSRDAAQRKVLKQLISSRTAFLGYNDIQLVAFSNSPPWWMTKSKCSAGNTDGSDNLNDDMYDDFADYLTDVVKHYHDSFGIRFNYIEPFNEPDENWWKAFKGQEGCFFSETNQVKMIRELYKKMTEKHMLSYTQITANDANTIDAGLSALKTYKAAGEIINKVPLISVHSYGGTKRTELKDFAATNNQKLWQSESGPLNVKGTNEVQMMTVANRIITDIKDLNCSAWIDWQLMADKSPTWGLIVGDYETRTFSKGMDFYIRAQYSRYLKKGYIIVQNSSPNVVTAISPNKSELIIVISNSELISQNYDFNFSPFKAVKNITQISTRALESFNVKNQETEFKIKGNNFSYDAPPQSVTTFIVPVK